MRQVEEMVPKVCPLITVCICQLILRVSLRHYVRPFTFYYTSSSLYTSAGHGKSDHYGKDKTAKRREIEER